MKKVISITLILGGLALTGCGEKKDYQYFSNHIDEAKRTASVCKRKNDTSETCQAALKAVIDWRNKIVENHTKATAWN